MTNTKFRNVEFDTAAPMDDWPFEAIHTVLERGGMDDWRRLAAAIGAEPWGRAALTTEKIVGWRENYGIDLLFERIIRRARERFKADRRSESAARLRKRRTDAGMSLRDLAAATGIAPANLSRYENGQVSPTLDVVARIEWATDPKRHRPRVRASGTRATNGCPP